MNPMAMGTEEFRAMRRRLKLSQTNLGNLFGVEYHTVGHWEGGKSSIPGSAKILLWLLHEEQVNKNSFAMRQYLRSIGVGRAKTANLENTARVTAQSE